MTIGKNTRDALKAYYNNPFKSLNVGAVIKDLEEESDRATVIIMGSIADDSLRFAIIEKLGMRKSPTKEKAMALVESIFGYNGALGPFSSRIAVAHAFQVIEDATREQLTILKEMRNACAHSQEPLRFSSPVLLNFCKNLWAADNDPFIPYSGDPPEQMRTAFLEEMMLLILALQYGSRADARQAYALHVAGTPWLDKRTLRGPQHRDQDPNDQTR